MHAARLLCVAALLGAAGLAAATGIGKPFTQEMMAERQRAWVSCLHAPARLYAVASPEISDEVGAIRRADPRGNPLTSSGPSVCVQLLFTALVEPKPPKNVTFPLEEQDDIEFHASREALIEWLKAQVEKYDLQDPHVRQALRDKVVIYQKKTQELLLAAVAEGKTLQQARIGMMIAHFESLPWDIQQRGMEQGKHVVTERTPKDTRKHGADRALAVHERELAEIRKLKTKAERW